MKPDFDLKDYESGFARFDSLMQFKVKDILLISSLFDSFILEEDGQLAQLVLTEYAVYNLTYAPHIRRVSTAQEGLEELKKYRYDLIIVVRRLYDYDIAKFTSEAKAIHSGIPVILLAFQHQELVFPGADFRNPPIDKTFIWSGMSRYFWPSSSLLKTALMSSSIRGWSASGQLYSLKIRSNSILCICRFSIRN